MCGTTIFEFVIYAWLPQAETWVWSDVPMFIVMSALLGVLTSFHTRGCLYFASVRQRNVKRLQRFQPHAKMLETVLFCGFCALVSAGTALLAACAENSDTRQKLEYVRFNCGEDQYNPVASLLVNTSHSAVKFLFSGNNTGEIKHFDALLGFISYYALNVLLTGLPVPGGAFTATMLLGGLFGRFIGEAGGHLGLINTVSGIYAVVGSAAMLCGFKQMTLAVVLIVVECVNNLTLGPVVMLGVAVSMSVTWLINERGHDEEQIFRKKLPLLEGESPHSLDDCVAGSLCDVLPDAAVLTPSCHIDKVKEALKLKAVLHFPVVNEESRSCVGIISRAHLEAVVESVTPSQLSSQREDPGRSSTTRSMRESKDRISMRAALACLEKRSAMKTCFSRVRTCCH